MDWMKYRIHTTEEAEDLVTGALYGLGIDSVEIEDRRPPSKEELAGLFGDVVPDMKEIYLDNSATAKPYPEVVEIVEKTMTEDYGNPSSMMDLASMT